MKTSTKHLWLNTKERIEFVNITDEVQRCIDVSEIANAHTQGVLT